MELLERAPDLEAVLMVNVMEMKKRMVNVG